MSAGRSKVSLNPSRPLRTFPREGTFFDESPALTAVLQAQRTVIVANLQRVALGDEVRLGSGSWFRCSGALSCSQHGSALRPAAVNKPSGVGRV
jgi:hypothetical protein